MKRRVFLKATSAAAGALAFPAIALGQQYKTEYKMSTVVPPAFAWGKGGEIFANLVRERTGGRINIKQYPGASLVQGDQTREFSAMRQGVIDVLCGAPINWYSTVREIAVFTLPFITPDDLKGLKIRVVGSPMYGEIMSGMGANPTFMSWADAQPALASGAVDGQENPMFLFTVLKMHNVGQKYVTTWG